MMLYHGHCIWLVVLKNGNPPWKTCDQHCRDGIRTVWPALSWDHYIVANYVLLDSYSLVVPQDSCQL